MAGQGTPIRSFRVVFALERRIHRIDRWRIPVPYGVPLRGVAYAIAALACVLAVQRLPLLGDALGLLAPPLRLVILPVGAAYLLTRLQIDGRPAHRAALAWLAHLAAPSFVASFRAATRPGSVELLGDAVFSPDGRSARPRRGSVEGPGRVLVRHPARARARGKVLELYPLPGEPMLRGKVIELRRGQRLEVRA